VTVDALALPGEHAGQWQEQVVRRLVDELGLAKLMFEAPHPEVESGVTRWCARKHVRPHATWQLVSPTADC
jgi:erythromycin esterase-like protein